MPLMDGSLLKQRFGKVSEGLGLFKDGNVNVSS
jgi:hypothetical protein